MNLVKSATKIFFTDLDTKTEYCVTFIDYEHHTDGYSVLVQKAIYSGRSFSKWVNIDATDTTRHPSQDNAAILLKLALKGIHT